MSVKVNIASYLQYFTNETAVVELHGNTIGECLDRLVKQYPDFKTVILTDEDELPSFIAVYVNGEDSYPDGLVRPVRDGDELSIAFAGGCCF